MIRHSKTCTNGQAFKIIIWIQRLLIFLFGYVDHDYGWQHIFPHSWRLAPYWKNALEKKENNAGEEVVGKDS